MRQGEDARTTDFIERLAEPVERISKYLERHDTHPLASDLEAFARLSLRQPLVVDGQAARELKLRAGPRFRCASMGS